MSERFEIPQRERGESPHDLLSSNEEIKKAGWENFLRYLPALVQKDMPSRRAIPVLHRLATLGASTKPVSAEFMAEATMNVITRGNQKVESREDLDALGEVAERYTKRAMRNGPQDGAREIYMTVLPLKNHGAEIKGMIFSPRRGHLRQWGKRSIDEGPVETIVAAHTKPLYFDTDERTGEYIFIGLTERLSELFNELCDRADILLEKAGNLDEKLEAIAYLQLWGAALIHPFVDGNGRAFSAKFVLDLNKIGFSVKLPLGLGEVHSRLQDNLMAAISDEFHCDVIEKTGLLLSAEQTRRIMSTPSLYDDYMHKLHDVVETGIRVEIPKGGVIREAIDRAVFASKLALSRDKHIDAHFYEENIGQAIEANRDT